MYYIHIFGWIKIILLCICFICIYIYMLCFYILPTQASKRNQTEVEYVSIVVVILFSGMIGVLHMVNLTST